jgi:hypothetical protein
MIWQSPKKVPYKVNEGIVTAKGAFAIRISNRFHWKAVFATMCLILLVILGIIVGNPSWSIPIAHADYVRGVGVGIYWDQGCTNRALSLDWGLIELGSNSTVIVYVRNEGDSAVSLRMATSNWTPSVALGYITLTWTYSGKILSADEVIPMGLNLNVSPTVSGITDFSFDIVITATGALAL